MGFRSSRFATASASSGSAKWSIPTCCDEFRDHFAAELAALGPLIAHGLVKLSDHALEVTPMGWFFVCAIAMVFDRHLQADRARARCSRIV